MSIFSKILFIMAGMLTCLAVGFYYGQGQKQVEIVEKRVEVAGEVRTEWRDRIVVVEKIVHPDGTVIEKTTTKDSSKQKEKKSNEVAKTYAEKTKASESRYSVGVGIALPSGLSAGDLDRAQAAWSVSVGYRILGPIFGEAGYHNKDRSVVLGMRLEI